MNASFGASPLITGAVVAGASLTTTLGSTQIGWLTPYFSEKTLIWVSFVLYAVALCLVPLMPSVGLLLVPTVLFGLAQSLNLPNAF